MYDVYLGRILLPVAPSKIQLKIKNQNKTLNLINEGQINILKAPGLTDISLTVMIPQMKYPFAKYKRGFQGAEYFLDAFENLKTERDRDGRLKPFQFIVSRTSPDGKNFFDTNLTVSMEDYAINEDAKNGLDISVDIKLKQYKAYGTKTIQIVTVDGKPEATVESQREQENAPQDKTYTVIAGDCLWAIAQKQLGNGNRYNEIYTLNQSTIDGDNKGTGNPKYTIYPNQVLTLPSQKEE